MWSQASAVLPLASKAKAKYSLLMITPQTFIRPNTDATKTRKKGKNQGCICLRLLAITEFCLFYHLRYSQRSLIGEVWSTCAESWNLHHFEIIWTGFEPLQKYEQHICTCVKHICSKIRFAPLRCILELGLKQVFTKSRASLRDTSLNMKLPLLIPAPLILSQALLMFSAGLWSSQKAMQIWRLKNPLQRFHIQRPLSGQRQSKSCPNLFQGLPSAKGLGLLISVIKLIFKGRI